MKDLFVVALVALLVPNGQPAALPAVEDSSGVDTDTGVQEEDMHVLDKLTGKSQEYNPTGDVSVESRVKVCAISRLL